MNYFRKQRNYGCRVHDQYTYMGMRVVVLENEKLRMSILADKGAEVFELLLKSRDLDYMWLTENGIQNPNRYLPTSPDSQSTFIDYYMGGWQEIFPNGGVSASYGGASFGQHGEVAHMPWDCEITKDTPELVQVKLSVKTRKVPFELSKTITLHSGSTQIIIDEEVANTSEVPLRYMWGQHLAFGKPFVEPGCTIKLPEGIQVIADPMDAPDGQSGRVKRAADASYVWPWVESLDGGTTDLSLLPPVKTPSEIVYLHGFQGLGWYEVENNRIGAGIRVEWDADRMPYLWYWQEFGQSDAYPWYSRHYNIGLEPFCGYPTHGLPEAIRNGSAGAVSGGETVRFRMSVELLELT